MLIKKRTAKKSDRGIYLQDTQLNQTQFKAGSHFKYIIDSKQKQIVIVPSKSDGNTVSRRKQKDNTLKPVIDIRRKEALRVFKNADQLEVEIYEDQIIVRGLVEEKENILSKVKNILPFKNKKTASANKKVKKKIEVQFSKHQLRNAVGQDFEQLTIFDVIQESKTVSSDSYFNTQSFKHALKNLNIPLQVISLFSGAGIMDQGFVEAGFEIKFALEKDEDAVKTYAHNIGNHIMQADIEKFDFTVFDKIGAPIMIAGPPCQGLSSANRKTNFLDNPNNKYIKYYIEAIKANSHCKVFVLENVEEILTAGNGRFKNEILSELSDFEITTGVI
ncbi:DNA cytosine methyltransferase, partial [Bacillus subtilis]